MYMWWTKHASITWYRDVDTAAAGEASSFQNNMVRSTETRIMCVTEWMTANPWAKYQVSHVRPQACPQAARAARVSQPTVAKCHTRATGAACTSHACGREGAQARAGPVAQDVD